MTETAADYSGFYIVIPSLDPDERLRATVERLRGAGFSRFVLVDDGSDSEHKKFFPEEGEPGITLLAHPANRGKGAALKTAFSWIIGHSSPGDEGVITVDGDGQHDAGDVAACADRLRAEKNKVILGCRDFSGKDVPARSRFGNTVTRLSFKLLCGIDISDTQTGLRAFPMDVLPKLTEIKGEKFEYETNMLLNLKRAHIEVAEVPIKTLYIDENSSSHFRPIIDSLRVYGFFIGYLLSSMIATVIDILLFYVIRKVGAPYLGRWTILTATVVSRAVSSLTNFTINRKQVFTSKEHTGRTLFRYYAVAIPKMLVSAGLVQLISIWLGGMPGIDTLIKALVDLVLVFVSYRLQQEWVFAEKRKK